MIRWRSRLRAGGASGAVAGADFRGGALAGPVTFSRASGGTVWNAAGTLLEVGVNAPRFDFDPATGQPLGLLVEPARTNLITHPRSVGGTGWTNTNLGSVTPVTARNGATEAATLAENVGTGPKQTRLTAAISYVSGQLYVYSAIARAGTLGFIQLTFGAAVFGLDAWSNFNLSAGTLGSVGSEVTARAIIPLGGGDFLIWAQAPATATVATEFSNISLIPNATAARNPAYTGTGATLTVQFPQMAEGAFPTSRVLPPVSTPAAATRAADVVSYAAPNGTWDELIQDTAGGEWRAGITVSGGSRTITPRTGQFHVRRVRLFPAGTAAANPGWAVAA